MCRVLTNLLPLSETVVVLVEPLPRRDLVLAVETREVDAACLVSTHSLWSEGRGHGCASSATFRMASDLTYPARRAMVGRIFVGVEWCRGFR